MAPEDEYLRLAEKYNGIVWVDDAHAVGIVGDTGRGTYEHFKLRSERLYMGGTLSKAFGAYGGFVTGSSEFIAEIKKSTVFSGTTSPMSAAVGASIEGLSLVRAYPDWRKRLWENAAYLKTQLNGLGINIEVNPIPVAAFALNDAAYMQQLQKRLMQKSIFVQWLKYVGAGPEGTIRIIVFSTHTKNR